MSARPRLVSVLPDDALVLLRELIGKVDALTAEVAGLRAALPIRKPVEPSQAEAELVCCIHRFAGELPFSTWMLLDHCTLPDSGELRDAIRGAVGSENGKKLGRLLKRLEDVDVGGLQLVRLGNEGGTARWSVRVSGV